MAPEELDKLFDRFYRADPARSGTGGFGIGLSIARSIAEGHKSNQKMRDDYNTWRKQAQMALSKYQLGEISWEEFEEVICNNL